jgi:hypothetical protein
MGLSIFILVITVGVIIITNIVIRGNERDIASSAK